MVKVRLLKQDELHLAPPFYKQLSPHIAMETLESRLTEMVEQGYRCAGLFLTQNGELIGICGLWILTKYYVGRHIEPDNLIILPQHRSKGYGEVLMNWVFEYGKKEGCTSSELNCYTENKKGNAFWEKLGYEKIANHYQKKL